ncbi:MAG: hypothetical protein ACR2MC_01010 [Actinomycetota bacterium]
MSALPAASPQAIHVSCGGSVIAGARSGQHDDLVMGLALCVLEDDSPGIHYGGPVLYPTDDWEDLHRMPPGQW